jgi:Ca2+-binding RTX toxin-like protein
MATHGFVIEGRTMTIQGVYVGNSPAELQQFENWLGSEVDAVHGVVGFANWKDYTSSASWMTNTLWKGINEKVLWSVPIMVNDGVASLATAATGAYNTYYRTVAQTLLASRGGDNDPIYVRTGWEANADWFPWSAIGKEASFIGAFRQMVETFRDISPRFKFEWNINYSEGGMDPAKMYPGDAYVDVVGMDFYWTPEYQGSDPVKAFNAIANAKYGLQWLENFADAHGKPTAYSEWGINSNNAPEYLKLVQAWFDNHDVAYQSFWDYTMDKVTALSHGENPNSGAAFKSLFGAGYDSGATTPAAPGGGTVGNGTSGHDTLVGTAGNDTLTGNGGDTMSGGKGDDTYFVNSAADVVVEKAGEGTDTVSTWLSHTLSDNVENLVLTGNGWSTGTGNALANVIIGNEAPNTLDGKGGNDMLTGGAGNDTFVIAKGQGSDIITDFSTSSGDVVKLDGFSFASFAAVKAASVQSGSDVVISLGDGQTLKLAGVQLSSLAADDFSLVNVAAAPTVTPPVATTPVVTTPAASDYALSGATTTTFSGTEGRDTLTGTSGNDLFWGKGGDLMKGGLGDDTYEVSSLGDTITELAKGGIDTVRTWISGYVLPAEVENLTLYGNGWSNGTGNAMNNRITGNQSTNTLDGKGGNDMLTGGAGNDTFVIAKGQGHDIITDFSTSSGDVVKLDGFSFASFAAVKAASVQSGSDVVISLGDGQTLKLAGVQLSSLAADDFSLVNVAAAPTVTPPVATTPVVTTPAASDYALSGATTTTFSGTEGRDTLTGTSGNDLFWGKGGDLMKGGLGDDTYEVSSLGDTITELAKGGIDTVRTWISGYVLPAEVENLTLYGNGWSNGTGNAMNNRITGNQSTNTLDGKGGNDMLTGGAGNDTFVIAKGQGHDIITDFAGAGVAGGDSLLLKGFGAGASLSHVGDDWSIKAADGSVTHVTITNVTALGASDYVFG